MTIYAGRRAAAAACRVLLSARSWKGEEVAAGPDAPPYGPRSNIYRWLGGG